LSSIQATKGVADRDKQKIRRDQACICSTKSIAHVALSLLGANIFQETHMDLRRIPAQVIGLAFAIALSALSTTAHADTITGNPLITVNEQGVGTLLFPAGPFPTVGVLIPDPGPGGLAAALTYNLLGPPNLVAGDVLILDSVGVLSDIIRFNPAGTGAPGYPASLVFYSDLPAEPGYLADTGFPSALYANNITFLEVGPEEGPNGLVYIPTSTQPGYVAGFAVTYNIQSDNTPIPEPATMVLLGSGLVGAFRARSRQKPRAK
jgi:hypothetical protein